MKTNRRKLLQALSLLPFVGIIKPAIAMTPIEEDVPPPESKDTIEHIKVSINGVDAYIPVYK